MRKNEQTIITGTKVVLVPYISLLVPKYHEWMKSEELQELTASEPLKLDEEYKMQQSWLEDDDKCTFIILDADVYKATNDQIAAMIGDTNLFFNHELKSTAEIEIMIAEPCQRGKRYGREALKLMMNYAVKDLEVKMFEAKIKIGNTPSLRLFESLGFVEVSRSTVFNEVTYHNSDIEAFK